MERQDLTQNVSKARARDPAKPKNLRKATPLFVGALALGMLVGGITAYQTDKDYSGNVFTIGSVRIRAWEPHFPTKDVDRDGVPDECEQITSHETIPKDPRIQNTGTNDAIVFFRVTAPVEELTLINDDGTRTGPADCDLFYFKRAADGEELHRNNFNPKWIELRSLDNRFVTCEGVNEENKGYTYIFGYHTKIKPSQYTETLFDKVQHKKYGSRTITANEVEKIKIESFAIQAEDIHKAGIEIPSGGELTEADLTYIYKAFVNQNQGVVGRGPW